MRLWQSNMLWQRNAGRVPSPVHSLQQSWGFVLTHIKRRTMILAESRRSKEDLWAPNPWSSRSQRTLEGSFCGYASTLSDDIFWLAIVGQKSLLAQPLVWMVVQLAVNVQQATHSYSATHSCSPSASWRQKKNLTWAARALPGSCTQTVDVWQSILKLRRSWLSIPKMRRMLRAWNFGFCV